MASEKQRILRWFYRQVYPPGVLEFDDLLAQAVPTVLGKSQFDTEAYVHQNRKRHWNALLERLDIDRGLGRSPLFIVRDITSRRISWVPNDIIRLKSSRDKHIAVRLSSRPYFLQAIDRLSDRQYEALGCVISKLAGATHVRLTPRGSEGGIDFFALIDVPARCHVFSGSYRPLRIIGQAKKYRETVQVDRVKELMTTIQEVRNQNPSVEYLVPPWFRTASGPVAGWLIAHAGVQAGGITKARNNGIIICDSLDLAEIAALSRRIDDTLPGKQRAKQMVWMVEEFLDSS